MRIMEVILNFRQSDIYDADKRRRVEQAIENLNSVFMSTSKQLTDGTPFDGDEHSLLCTDALIARGIQKLDKFDNWRFLCE